MHVGHDQSDRLTLENPLYCEAIRRVVFDAEDISSNAVIPKDATGVARIVLNGDGVLAGVMDAGYLAPDMVFFKHDGDFAVAGDVIAEWSGNVRGILKMERSVLNVLSRMSGIATFTRRLVDSLSKGGPLLCPTRKTLWGLLDKRAVAVGGGGTHRLDAGDAILLKDNHLAYFCGDVAAMMEQLEAYIDAHGAIGRFIEVEAESVSDADKALALLSHIQHLRVPLAILLDNMSVSDVTTVVGMRRDNGLDKTVALEVSGGITERNLSAYAETGVDIISMGSLTMNAPALDFSLHIEARA